MTKKGVERMSVTSEQSLTPPIQERETLKSRAHED
jgi:hypothetical protein